VGVIDGFAVAAFWLGQHDVWPPFTVQSDHAFSDAVISEDAKKLRGLI
jgi:hypothetical protein